MHVFQDFGAIRALARPLLNLSQGTIPFVGVIVMHSHAAGAGGGSALDMIASLQALTAGLKPPQGATDDVSPFDLAPSGGASASVAGAGGGAPSMTPGTMNALFAAQSQTTAASAPSSLASQLF